VPGLLLVFLKWPEPGLAKTRLVPELGAETAAAVSRLLAEAAIEATRPQAGEFDRLLCFAPAGAESRIRSWFPGEAVWPQPEGDLGHRMASAFAEAFSRGAKRVALVGTDVPGITSGLVAQSLEALATTDLVLGPAHDGGYYLIALDRPRPELFAGIEWSRPEVLDATQKRAEGLHLRTTLLEALADVDGIVDVVAGWDRLEGILGRDPAVRDAVRVAIARRPLARFGAQ
jgi:uncharacterized protein